MSRTTFIALCVAAVLAVVATVAAVRQQAVLRTSDAVGAPVFPGLTHRLNGLKTVVIRSKDGDLTFDWNGTTWVSRERDGYPADAGKVASLVVQLAQAEKIEAKTRLPQKYARLQLDDPHGKDSEAREVVVLDDKGAVLADMIIGKTKFSLGSKENGAYVRVPGDAQTWLVRGDLDPGPKLSDWLVRKIADIKESDIGRVTVVHPDGSKVIVERDGDQSFKIANLPHGKEAAGEGAGGEIVRVLSDLQLDDVAPATKIVLPDDKITTATFECFGGVRVTLETADVAGNTWLRIHADRLASPATTSGGGAVDWDKIVADINARGASWVFQVPPYEISALKKTTADFVKKPDKASKS